MFTKNLALALSGFSLYSLAASDCPTVLLDSEAPLKQGESIVKDGLVLTQQFDGKLELYMQDEEGGLECLIWESSPGAQECDAYDPTTRFSSKLQLDANIVTREFDENGANTVFWATGFNCLNDSCNGVQPHFIANCDGSVGTYPCSDPASCDPVWTENLEYNCMASSPPACRSTEVLKSTERVLSGGQVDKEGIYLVQKRDGVFQVWEEDTNILIWEACPDEARIFSDKYTELQTDSNLVVRDDSQSPARAIWASGSTNEDGPWLLTLGCNTNDVAQLQFAGISITNGARTVWEDTDLYPDTPCVPLIPESTPACPTATVLLAGDEQRRVDDGEFVSQGGYTLAQGADGNFQVWRGDLGSIQCVLWESGTSRTPSEASYTVMQTDGNLVTYHKQNDDGEFIPVWSTGTAQTITGGDYHLVVDDCNGDEKLAIYREDPRSAPGSPLWTQDLGDCSNAPSMTPSLTPSNAPSMIPSVRPSEATGKGKGKRSGTPANNGVRRTRGGRKLKSL